MGNTANDDYGEPRYREALMEAFKAEDLGLDVTSISHLTASQLALMELVVSRPACSRAKAPCHLQCLSHVSCPSRDCC